MLQIILLVIFFRAPEGFERCDFSRQLSVCLLFNCNSQSFSFGELFVVGAKDRRAILASDVEPLSVTLRWIVDREEVLQ